MKATQILFRRFIRVFWLRRVPGFTRSQLLLALIIILAALVRLLSVSFGLPALLDSDELIFELGAFKMLSGGNLNPGWFGHPATTTMYVLAMIDVAVFLCGRVGGIFASVSDFSKAVYLNPSILVLPGRIAMVVFSLICIWLTYRLAKRLFGHTSGLLAAAILMLSPLHITYSQVIRSDMMATTFMLAAILYALDLARHGCKRDLIMASFFTALAIVTKWPFGLVLISIAGALFIRTQSLQLKISDALSQFVAAIFLVLVFVLLISPYLIIDHQTLIENIQGEAQNKHLGATGGGPFYNAWWYVSGPLLSGLGPFGLATGIAALFIRKTRGEYLPLVGSVGIGFFILICFQQLVWERWALPLVPILAISASCLSVQSLNQVVQISLSSRIVVMAIALIVMFLPLAVSSRTQSIERINDTRLIATAWIKRHAAPGSTVLVEHFAFDLMGSPLDIKFPVGLAGCLEAKELLKAKVQYSRIDELRGGNSNLDYSAVPKSKRPTCDADYMVITEFQRYAEEKSSFPYQFLAYKDLISRHQVLARFKPVPGELGGKEVIVLGRSKN